MPVMSVTSAPNGTGDPLPPTFSDTYINHSKASDDVSNLMTLSVAMSELL